MDRRLASLVAVAPSKGAASVQEKGNGTLTRVLVLGASKQQLDSGYTLEVELTGLSVGLNIRVRKRESVLFFPDEKFNTCSL